MMMTTDDTERVQTPRHRRPLWPWLLLSVLLLVLVAALLGTAALITLAEGAREGVQVTINGERWEGLVFEPEYWPLAFAGIATALLVLLVAVPCAVLMALAVAALGVGVAVLAMGVLAAVVLSPLWLVVGVLWLLLRRRETRPATMHA